MLIKKVVMMLSLPLLFVDKKMIQKLLIALNDLIGAYSKRHLILMLGWQDIKQKYRRSKLGPFWLTISMGIMIGMIGIIFGQALKQPIDLYLPYLASGIIFWNFISSAVNEGSSSFISSAGMIRQLGLPLAIYPSRVLWRNVVVLLHNIIILPFVLLVAGKAITINILWIIPGFILLVANLFWISLFLGLFCTRFRDMPPIVASIVQVFFYITPIIWMPSSVGSRVSNLIVQTNPVYYLLDLVRSPILGNAPQFMSWCVALSIFMLGSFVTLFAYGAYRKRIAYWI